MDKVTELNIENDKIKTDYEQLKQQVQLSQNEYQTLKTNYESS